jgi:hypothetical protein
MHLSEQAEDRNDNDETRTASPEELGEHVERVGVLVLATFVGPQALFTMSVVNLLFLPLDQHTDVVDFSLRDYYDSLLGQRGSRTLRCVR